MTVVKFPERARVAPQGWQSVENPAPGWGGLVVALYLLR